MFKKILFAISFFLVVIELDAQVLISSDIFPGPPNNWSMLEVRSSSRGFLPPSWSANYRTTNSSATFAPNGLLVFDTDSMALMLKINTGWVKLQRTSDVLWGKLGNNTISGTSGNVGIGTNGPSAKLEVASNSTGTSPQLKLTETVANNYTRLNLANPNSPRYWAIASVNNTTGQNLDEFNIFHPIQGNILKLSGNGNVALGGSIVDNTSNYSFATGYSNAYNSVSTAMGQSTAWANYSTAIGRKSYSSGFASIAGGDSSITYGKGSTAFGQSVAHRDYSTALGKSKATGEYSTALGTSTSDSAYSTAVGYSWASNYYATALGSSVASGYGSVAGGFSGAFGAISTAFGNSSIAKADGSTVFGEYTKAKSIGGTVIGIYNDTTDIPSLTTTNLTDRLFQIGNGDRITYVRSNALTVLRNANTGIGNIYTPIEKLEIDGAIKIGNATASPANGTIRYTAAGGFEGRHSGSWQPLTTGSGGSSQWTTNGNNISNSNTGNVGIGTSTPYGKLQIADSGAFQKYHLNLEETTSNGYSRLGFTNNNNIYTNWAILAKDKGNSNINTLFNIVREIHPPGGSPFTENVFTLGADYAYLKNNLGLGVLSPIEKLEVAGAIKIGNTTAVNPANGLVAYNGTDFVGYHNGWKSLTASTNYTAGSGISITGTTISTTPQTLSLTGNNLTLSNGGGTVSLPSGSGGSSNWDLTGNNISNNNTGKVLMGDAPFNTASFSPRFQIRDNSTSSSGGQQVMASVIQSSTSYSTALLVADSGSSGNPKGSPISGQPGNAGVHGFSRYGDAFYGHTENGRGLYIYGGNSFGNSAAQFEHKLGSAYTALKTTGGIDITGSLKIVDGTQATGKILTSDANGNATWQTPNTGSTYTAGTGITISGSNVIATNLVAGTGISISGNTISATGSSSGAGGWNRTGTNVNLQNIDDYVGIGTNAASGYKVRALATGSDNGMIISAFSGKGIEVENSSNTNPAAHFISSNNVAVRAQSGNIAGSFSSNAGTALILNDGLSGASGNALLVPYGKVGFGTNSPTAGVHINTTLRFQNGNEGANKVLTSDANGNASWQNVQTYWDYNGTDLTNSILGNVGINTLTPVEKLDVNGGVRVGFSSNTNAGTIRYNVGSFEGYDGTSWKSFGSPIQTNSNTNYIPTTNLFAVGTNNASAKLHIKSTGNSFLPQVMVEEESLMSPSAMQFKNAGSTNYWGITTYNANTSAGSYFTINNNGTSVLSMTADGNATLTGTLTQNSDKRLKKNIHPLSNVLTKIHNLNGYSYNWIDAKKDDGLQIGLLAQEVQQQFPELVKKDNNGNLSVAYGNMVPILLQAIKEQQKEIEELKAKLANQETNTAKLLTELMKKMEALQTLVLKSNITSNNQVK